mmetsp:Transcript_18858/g.72686  ORF Transcript_18858/g.72686 Transcript_18858/m.72686 type:complete len:679 (+) Transcript_18858:31-2067(+)
MAGDEQADKAQLRLSVALPSGDGGDTLTMQVKVDSNMTVDQAIAVVFSKYMLHEHEHEHEENLELLGLFMSRGSLADLFMEGERTLAEYGLKDRDVLVLKKKPVAINVLVMKTLYVDPTSSLRSQIGALGKKFGYGSAVSASAVLLKPTTSLDSAAFGVKRGACLLDSCDCRGYHFAGEGGPCMNCGHFPASHAHLGLLMGAAEGGDEDAVHYEAMDMSTMLESGDVNEDLPLILKVDPTKVLNSRNYLAVARSKRKGKALQDSAAIPACDSPKLKNWARKLRSIREAQAEFENTNLFGVHLADVMSRPNEIGLVPQFVQRLTEYLEKNALDFVGLFRVSGNQDHVNVLRKIVNMGEELDFADYEIEEVSSLLKQYLQALPDPLLTSHLYTRFITAAAIEDEGLQLQYLGSLVATLPEHNKDLLRFLLAFLTKVVANQEVNKMTSHNVAIVFGPLCLVSKDASDPAAALAHANLITVVVRTLIEKQGAIFEGATFALHTVRALNAYNPPAGDDSYLPVKQNSIIHVFKKDDSIWYGEIDGKVGKFPRSEISKASSKRILRATHMRQPHGDHPHAEHKRKLRPFSVAGLPGRSKSALVGGKKSRRSSTKVENPLFGAKTEMVGPQVATRTLPKGFDPSSFEEYLEDEDFNKLFGCSRQEYLDLPDEQKACLKKQAGVSM